MTLNKRKVKKKQELIIIIIVLSFVLVIGIVIGMIIQQNLIIKMLEGAGEGLEGIVSEMNIEIDLNETQIVEATYKIFPEEMFPEELTNGTKQ